MILQIRRNVVDDVAGDERLPFESLIPHETCDAMPKGLHEESKSGGCVHVCISFCAAGFPSLTFSPLNRSSRDTGQHGEAAQCSG
jgi:hypothetical protein